MRFLDDNVGVAFVTSEEEGTDMFWTRDRGAHWVKTRHLQWRVGDCGVNQGELWCGAGMNVVKVRKTRNQRSRSD